jgi:hypothetical protein
MHVSPLRYLVAFIALPLISTQMLAKGGPYTSEDRYDPQHIENLPPEIRAAVSRSALRPEPFIRSLIMPTASKQSSCTMNISIAAQAACFAARQDACIRSMFRRMATSCLYEAITPRLENESNMDDVAKFRTQAEEARQQAEKAIRSLDKEMWLKIAGEWIKLAEAVGGRAKKVRPPRFGGSPFLSLNP